MVWARQKSIEGMMRTYFKLTVILLFLFLWAFLNFYQIAATKAQTASPSPYFSANQQSSDFPTVVGLECAGCHGPGKTLPNLGGEKFHKDAHGAYATSVHARALSSGKPAATCRDCHTQNGDLTTALPAENPNSTVNRHNMARTCGACHQNYETSYHFSIHGSKQDSGTQKAASCADCHGSHGIFSGGDVISTVNRRNTAETVCAKCHSDKVVDWENSSHGAALRAGNTAAPTCTSCHTAVSHLSAPITLRDFNMQMIENCSKCHTQQAPSYRDTFHGQASALNFRLAATCADCHTPHKNLPASDPASSVHAANRVQTCSSCHTGINANFASYDPHPQPENPARSQLVYYISHFMEWLLIGVFSFFGVHTLLWIQRSLVARFTEKRKEPEDEEEWVMRFAPIHRFTHVLIATSFIILAATGLPLMFYYTEWGRWLEQVQGGVAVTRFLHRVCAVITFGYAFIHLGFVIKKAVIERKFSILYGPDSMMIRKQDFVDAFNMLRWFLYLGPRPELDRWTYWEKFDYFAVFWGVPVIGISGLMLWFPAFFTNFLPGEFLNAAMIIHGEEALLATAFIFAFHFFHNHLRPENFPMDTVIFTGKMPLSRFKEERLVEYERLVGTGSLDTVLTGPPTFRARVIAKTFGFIVYIAGLIMVIAIFATLLVYRH